MAVTCWLETQDGLNLAHDHTETPYTPPLSGSIDHDFTCVPITLLEVSFSDGSVLETFEIESTTLIFNFLEEDYIIPNEPIFNFTNGDTNVYPCGSYTLDGSQLLQNHFTPNAISINGNVVHNHECFGTCTDYIPENSTSLVLELSNETYTPENSTSLSLNVDCNLIPVEFGPVDNVLFVEPFKFEVLFKSVFADCEPYRPAISTDVFLNTSQLTHDRGVDYSKNIVLNSDCYTLLNFNFELSSAYGSSLETELTEAPTAEFELIIRHGTDNSANISQINVNLSETCTRATSPLDVNVCQAGYVANYEHGALLELDLVIFEGVKLLPYAFEHGQEIDITLTQFDQLFPELYETGEFSDATLTQFDQFYPELYETGQELVEFDVTVQPRAFIDVLFEYGSDVVAEAFPNTFNLPEECGYNNSPLNFNLCSTISFANVFHGAYVETELFTVTGAVLVPNAFETGHSVDFELARYFFLEADGYFGSEVLSDIATFYQPVADVYFGSVLEDADLTIPPRAFFELDGYFGSECLFDALSTTVVFDTTNYFGSEVDAYLTPACITSIPFNIWKDGYWDSDCNSTNRTAYAKFYTFTLAVDKVVTIDLQSTSPSDNFLYLLNGHGDSGTIIDSDDDSGGSGNAKIVYSLLAGDYTVEATTFAANQSGAFQVRVALPSPNIENIDAYHGQTLDNPILRAFYNLESDNYFGSTLAELDLEINPFDKLEVNYEFGSTLELATISYDPTFEPTNHFGSEVEVDLLANPFDKLQVNFEFGSDGSSFLATTDLFEGDVYHGALVKVDLLANPFDKLEVNFGFGSEAVTDAIYRQPSFNCYCFFGSESVSSLQTAPSEGLGSLKAYHGAEFILDAIATEEFTIFNYFGSSVDFDLETFQVFDVTNYFGSEVEVDLLDNPFDKLEVNYEFGSDANYEISVQLGFKVDYDFGSDSVASIALPPRAYMELDAYHGAFAYAPETVLHLRPIEYNVGLNFRIDHNHCEACCDNVDPIYHDSTIRVDRLDFDFSTDNFKDDYPWTICDKDELLFEAAFQTNPRFVLDFEVDSAACVAFIPQEYLVFIEGVPPEYIYIEYPPQQQFKVEFEVEFAVTTGAWVWGDNWTDETYYTAPAEKLLPVELSVFWHHEMYAGDRAICTLDTQVAEWKTDAFHDMINDVNLDIQLEVIDYLRFCPGYIIPNGNQVNFEFYGFESTDCNAEWIYTGETCEIALQGNVGMAANLAWPAHLTVSLTTEPPWKLHARHGPQLIISLAATPKFQLRTVAGSRVQASLAPDVWTAGHSTVKVFCDLAVPGPDLLWFTPPDCLANQFVKLDDKGDLDYSYYQPDPTQDFLEFDFEAVTENRQFVHALVAKCFKPEGSN